MEKTNGKFIEFVKKNAFYLVLALCIVAVGVSLLLVLTKSSEMMDNQSGMVNSGGNVGDLTPDDSTPVDKEDGKEDEQTPSEPTVTVIEFAMPVENSTSVFEYSEQPVFNSTLNRFSAHMGIDFICEEDAKVFCAFDGKVISVTKNELQGTTITIDHGNDLMTVYNSLLDGEMVTVGKQVKKGEQIGVVSNTNRQEADKGHHVHFEVLEKGEKIDPSKYLDFGEK